ncbi:MAG: hypothetical protein IJR08_00905 [Bacilli bacterium]|nr:hypothetical protein [Bacilli bacterium]
MAKTPIYKTEEFKHKNFSEMTLYRYAKEALTEAEFLMFERIVVLKYSRKDLETYLGVKITPMGYEEMGLVLINKVVEYMDKIIKSKEL